MWVGTGETWTRNSVSIGDGIYKSTDAGETWAHMGLAESERIARIVVHPKSSNVVYACVTGKLWSDSKERGVYRTTDGGKTWSLILSYVGNASTGCSSLTLDPQNPDVLFAGTWDFRRKGWTFRSGGDGPNAPSGSALLRTADGGRSWKTIDGNGLPPHPWGRMEVVIAPSSPKRVYAFIESEQTLHLQFRKSDIDSVQIADYIQQKKEWQQAQKQFADGPALQVQIGGGGHQLVGSGYASGARFSLAIISDTIASGDLSTVTLIAS